MESGHIWSYWEFFLLKQPSNKTSLPPTWLISCHQAHSWDISLWQPYYLCTIPHTQHYMVVLYNNLSPITTAQNNCRFYLWIVYGCHTHGYGLWTPYTHAIYAISSIWPVFIRHLHTQKETHPTSQIDWNKMNIRLRQEKGHRKRKTVDCAT